MDDELKDPVKNRATWMFVARRDDWGTEDFRLSTSAGDFYLTLWGDAVTVSMWSAEDAESDGQLIEEYADRAGELLEGQAEQPAELTAKLEYVGVPHEEADRIVRELWPTTVRAAEQERRKAKKAARRERWRGLLRLRR